MELWARLLSANLAFAGHVHFAGVLSTCNLQFCKVLFRAMTGVPTVAFYRIADPAFALNQFGLEL